jgi:hypothetical protein
MLSTRRIFTEILRLGSAAPDFAWQKIQAANFAVVAGIPADRHAHAARFNSLGELVRPDSARGKKEF